MDYVVPFDQLGVATPGPWTNASPQAGIKGSIVNANVFPAVQQEILNVQDEAGLTRDGTNFAQLLQAIRSGKLTFFQDTGTADALVITPRTSFPSLGAGLALSVLKGTSPNATKTPALSVGGLVQTIVKEDGSALAIGDLPGNCLFSVRSDGTNFRVVGLRRSDTVLTNYGATSKGGLAIDGSSNFLLSLIANLTADNRSAPVAADILALGRAADGAMVGVSAAKLATYILSNIVATATFQQIVPNPTLYVDAVNGLDTNPGTLAAPFKTIGAALAAGTSKYTFTSGTLTVQLINGSPSNLFTPPTGAIPVGSGIILIQGDTANPQNYVISGSGPAGGSSSILQAQSTVQILGCTVQNTSTNNSSFGVSGNGSLYLQNVASQTTQSTSGAHFSCVGASLTFGGGVTATGNAANLISATSGAKPTIFGTLQIVGNATFSNATLYYDLNSAVVVEPGATITTTGTVTGVRYLGYRSSACRILNGLAGNALPGSTAGTADATTFASYG